MKEKEKKKILILFPNTIEDEETCKKIVIEIRKVESKKGVKIRLLNFEDLGDFNKEFSPNLIKLMSMEGFQERKSLLVEKIKTKFPNTELSYVTIR